MHGVWCTTVRGLPSEMGVWCTTVRGLPSGNVSVAHYSAWSP